MSCRFSRYATNAVGDKVDQLKADLNKMRAASSKKDAELAEIFAKFSDRLDTIEQALADPHGAAVEKLKAKHGMAKRPKRVAKLSTKS